MLQAEFLRDALNTAGKCDHADLRLGKPEAGCGAGDNQIARQGELEPSAKREAIHCCDDRLCEIEAGRHPAEAGRRKIRCIHRQSLGKVLPGAKGTLSRSGNDRDPRLVIGGKVVNRSCQFEMRWDMQGVADCGPRDRDDGYRTAALDLDMLECRCFGVFLQGRTCHAFLPPRPG